jgi:telomerase reverse transcriptase
MSIVLTPPPPLSKRLRHKTLSAYYPHLQTLRDYLVSTLGCPLTQLLHPDDPERYTELLDTTISAVLSDDHARLWNDAGRWGDVEGTQQEAIDRIMREVARSATRNHRDVLLSGSRVRTSLTTPLVLLTIHDHPWPGRKCLADTSQTYSEDLPINTNRPTIENRHVNSPSSVLRTLEWKILRSRLGDQGFRHLLVHTSLFLTVGNNCFIQLSGTPLYDMYDAKGPKGIRGMKRSSEVDQGVDKGTGDQRRRKRRSRNGGGGGGGGGDGSDGGALGDREERMALHQMKRKVSASGKGKGRAVGPADEPVARQRMFYGHPAKRADGKLLPGVPPSRASISLSLSIRTATCALMLPLADILNKLMPSRDYIIDNTACLRLVRAVFPALFGRARQSHHDGVATVDLERDLQRLSRSCSRRIPPLIGVMRELVVRHSSTDYRTLLWRCIERRGGTDGELQPVSHSQVRGFLRVGAHLPHS